MAIMSSPAARAPATSSAGSTMPSEAVVWQCGSASPTGSGATGRCRPAGLWRREQRGGEEPYVEGGKLIDPLAHPDQLGRYAELLLDGHDCATPGCPVHLGQHQPADLQSVVESLR